MKMVPEERKQMLETLVKEIDRVVFPKLQDYTALAKGITNTEYINSLPESDRTFDAMVWEVGEIIYNFTVPPFGYIFDVSVKSDSMGDFTLCLKYECAEDNSKIKYHEKPKS